MIDRDIINIKINFNKKREKHLSEYKLSSIINYDIAKHEPKINHFSFGQFRLRYVLRIVL